MELNTIVIADTPEPLTEMNTKMCKTLKICKTNKSSKPKKMENEILRNI